MTPHETAIAERLHEAAGRIPVTTDPEPVIAAAPGRRSGLGSRPAVLAAAAVVVVVAAAAVGAARLAGDGGTVEAGTTVVTDDGSGDDGGDDGPPPVPVVGGGPHVVAPPAWFGEPRGGTRDGGIRRGRWVAAAVGQVAGDRIGQPIQVAAFDGTWGPMLDAESVVIDGRQFASLEIGEWRALASRPEDSSITTVASGRVGQPALVAVLDAAGAFDRIDQSVNFGLRPDRLPEGYTEVVTPRPLGPDPAGRRVVASEDTHTSLDEGSDWTDPLLLQTGSGDDVTAIDVGGTPGWIVDTSDHPHGPLRSLAWSPAPGVVLFVTTDDMGRTPDDLVDLALTSTTVTPADWDATYGPFGSG